MDTHSGGAHLTLTMALVFSGVIEEAKLRVAITRLARAWPMLGSRLRRVSPEVSIELKRCSELIRLWIVADD